ncbi:hypothetical protein M8C21_028466 [Ambrosia artemisiifolia]|uniref:WAT1-related protein n=1 Tax=Ambrosia artemisiifolia TaxID=4212 RepID=A0AAD5D9R8_AMBAR|nr:hypothetical protein M8C21_028466 [Ambrosia artemisiifolia]
MSMTRTDHTWSWTDDVLPFVALFTVTCLDIVVLTIVKAAMNDGLGSMVYVIYHNALGTFILLPFFMVHIIRTTDRPPLTFGVLFRFFVLGLLGICLFQVLWFVGVDYTSPTMASAIGNLFPGITFMISIFFRIEKIDMRNQSSVAKILGTTAAITGAMVFSEYYSRSIKAKKFL